VLNQQETQNFEVFLALSNARKIVQLSALSKVTFTAFGLDISAPGCVENANYCSAIL
jgi:hypothetical protein